MLLHLTWEVAQERGLDFVNAVFRHDEFTLKPTIDFVRHYASMPWVRMYHLCIPEPGLRTVFDRTIVERVAPAVAAAAVRDGVIRKS